MGLPKIDLPLFELELPSNGTKIMYRPFTVKEEKILLLAQETKDINQSILAVKQVVNNCIQGYVVDDMAMFDLEYVLLTLRAKSVDNNVVFGITDPETGESVKLELDLDEVKIIRDESHSNMIKLNDDYILKMRYPTIGEFITLVNGGIRDAETNYKIMIACMDQLLSNDEVYHFKNFTEKEIDEFTENLEGSIIKKIKSFFENMPKLRHEMKYTNSKGNEKTFVIEGMETFFI